MRAEHTRRKTAFCVHVRDAGKYLMEPSMTGEPALGLSKRSIMAFNDIVRNDKKLLSKRSILNRLIKKLSDSMRPK